ncbi:MAG: hypothetical protein PWP65_495 [Clostridia bacterium]|nr:hypothetical protein [Clostridia bacterium]
MLPAELNLAQQSEILFYREVLDALPDGILIVDKDCVIRYINPAWTRIRKLTKEQVVGKTMQQVRTGRILSSVLRTGQPVFDVHKKIEDEEYVVTVIPIKQGSQIIGGVSISKDIAEVKRLIQVVEKSAAVITSQKIDPIGKEVQYTFEDIVGRSKAIKELIEKAKKVARTDSSILIRGESGTGKELFAQAIHNASNRRYGYFVAVNCAAIPADLLESELFGYEPGAFTGADKKGKMGLFQLADKGTIFLDEIGDMPLSLQGKLLRVLQDGVIRRVGATSKVDKVDVRVIAATNRNIEELIAQKSFREDLYYRLNVIPLVLPPLRERREDILTLAEHFLETYNKKFKRKLIFSPQVTRVLYEYDWPGNIRELKNAIEYAVNMAEGPEIMLADLPENVRSAAGNAMPALQTLEQMVMEAERQAIMAALNQYGTTTVGKRKAARALGISLACLYKKIKKLQQHHLLKHEL